MKLDSTNKHIIRNNKKLSTVQKQRLMDNFVGYDISYDMVRLSMVNMYLHGFSQPHIFEYDTLTYEDHWDDTFDVIMANPPFMSPKGGIRPHNRFAIRAKRSEVLFVDYIAEHLNPSGRAGVIVPEGIIFQSQNAYKALRKMLVENYLWAVVSLPSGVFNPYSGVKTSILLMDKSLAKRIEKILFIKIENDGFDLGAQRRPIYKNDIAAALKFLNIYKSKIENYESQIPEDSFAHAVLKYEIARSADWNLSGERYKTEHTLRFSDYKWVTLGKASKIKPPKSEVKNLDREIDVSFVPMKDLRENQISFKAVEKRKLGEVINGYTYFRNNDVLLAKITPCFENGKSGIAKDMLNGIGFGSTEFIVLRPKENVLSEWIYYSVSGRRFLQLGRSNMTGSAGQQRVPTEFVSSYEIPLPPLDVQKQIVAEIEGYQKIIDGARQVVDNYKPTIKIDPVWPIVSLEKVCDFKRGPFGGSLKKEIFVKNGYKVYEQKHAIKNDFGIGEYYITEEKYNEMIDFALKPNDLIISCSGTMGRIAIVPEKIKPGIINQALLKLTPLTEKAVPFYIKLVLESDFVQNKYFRNTAGAAIQNVSSVKVLKKIELPLPSIHVQKEIVAQIEAEQQIINANKKLMRIYEQKIKDKIAEVWGE